MGNPPVLTAVEPTSSVDHHRRGIVGRPRGRRTRGGAPASAKVRKSHGTGAAKAQGTFGARGLRYRTNGALESDEVLRMDEVYKARWPEAENKFKAFKAIGFEVNRDRFLVLATSRGTDGAIERLEARDDARQGEIDALCQQPPSARVFAKIETRAKKQAGLRDAADALRAQPLTKKVRPPSGMEMLCKYLQVLLCNALALVRELLWGRSATADVTPRCVTLWIDPVAEARQRLQQFELLRLFNDAAPLRLHGARIRLRLAEARGIDSS